jgi:hypothetical protein
LTFAAAEVVGHPRPDHPLTAPLPAPAKPASECRVDRAARARPRPDVRRPGARGADDRRVRGARTRTGCHRQLAPVGAFRSAPTLLVGGRWSRDSVCRRPLRPPAGAGRSAAEAVTQSDDVRTSLPHSSSGSQSAAAVRLECSLLAQQHRQGATGGWRWPRLQAQCLEVGSGRCRDQP